MTPLDLRELNEDNYEYIKALNIIVAELMHKGKIVSDERCGTDESVLIIIYDNIRYTIHTFHYDICKSIEWERMTGEVII